MSRQILEEVKIMMKKVSGLFLCFLFIAVGCGFAAESVVKVQKAGGDVQYRLPSVDAWTILSVGNTIKSGAQVRTGADGSAILVWDSRHVVKLGPLTSVTIESSKQNNMESTKLNMTSGNTFSKVQKLSQGSDFSVQTPSAVAGVRGTAFDVNLPPDGNPTVSVVEGEVTVQNLESALESIVTPGNEININSMEVQTIPPDSLTNLNSSLNEVNTVEQETSTGGTGTPTETGNAPAETTDTMEEALETSTSTVVDTVNTANTNEEVKQTGTIIFDVH